MASVRKQTVTFSFPGTRVPSGVEFWEFVTKKYGVELKDLMMVQVETSGRRVHVKFVSNEWAEKVAEADEALFEYTDGELVKVRVQGPGQAPLVVRVRNLPMEVSTKCVELALGQFGSVLDVRDERYPRGSCFQGLLTGNRLVRMVIKRPIPSYVRVDGIEAMVFHKGQKPTCQVCDGDDHLRSKCPNRKRAPTWADRTRGLQGQEADDDVRASPPPSPRPRHGSAPELRGQDDVSLWEQPAAEQTTAAEAEAGVAPPPTERPLAAEQTTLAEPEAGVAPPSTEIPPAAEPAEQQPGAATASAEPGAVPEVTTLSTPSDKVNDGIFMFPEPRPPRPAESNGRMDLDKLLNEFPVSNAFEQLRSRTSSVSSVASQGEESDEGVGGAGRAARSTGRKLRSGNANLTQNLRSLVNNPSATEASLKRAASRLLASDKPKKHAPTTSPKTSSK